MSRMRGARLFPLIAVVALLSPRLAAADPPDPWFGRDKALHFSASATLAVGGYGLGALWSPREPIRLGTGATLALGAGIAKEIADRYTGGDPSLRDLTWDAVGTASGLLVAWLLDRYVF
jgi:putative lipoprotein